MQNNGKFSQGGSIRKRLKKVGILDSLSDRSDEKRQVRRRLEGHEELPNGSDRWDPYFLFLHLVRRWENREEDWRGFIRDRQKNGGDGGEDKEGKG